MDGILTRLLDADESKEADEIKSQLQTASKSYKNRAFFLVDLE